MLEKREQQHRDLQGLFPAPRAIQQLCPAGSAVQCQGNPQSSATSGAEHGEPWKVP